jgi:hypothetical protein
LHKPADLPGDWEKWLPPPPYDEMVRDFLRHARATLVWEDPAQPPLMACEDGGMISLPLVRYDDVHHFHAADNPAGATISDRRITKYSDVCATIDRIKAIWGDQDEISPAEWTEVNALLDDALYMIQRLHRRHEAYDQTRDRLVSLVAALQAVDSPQTPPADEGAEGIRSLLESGHGRLSACREDLDALAEQVRDVAQRHEDRAHDKKRLWVSAAVLYHQVRGPRDWGEDEARVAAEDGDCAR